MPATAIFQERVLIALEALDTNAVSQTTALEALQTALEAVQVSQNSIAGSDGSGAFSITYVFPGKDFGGADFTEVIETPPGFRGTVKAVTIYDVTEAFTSTTTAARVEIGDGTDPNGFAFTADFIDIAADASDCPALTQGVLGAMPANDTVTVTGVAATGGSPDAGIGTVAVTINYYL